MLILFLYILLSTVNAIFADADHCLWQGKRRTPGESWALGCKVHSCGDDGKVNTVIKEGCKVDGTCYEPDDLVKPNACSALKCGLNGILGDIKIGCDTSEGCKKNKEIWGKIDGESCVTEKCIARLVRGKRFISKVESLARSKHCKEKNADVCHRRGTNWYEYDSEEDKCHGIKCGVRGRRQLKRMKACAFDGQCIPFGQSPKDKPGCLCARGRMVCSKGPI